MRIDNPDGNSAVMLALAGLLKSGETGLDIVPEGAGLVADLYTEDGQLVAFGKSIIDMRTLEAGGYLLRVYSADGAAGEDTDFQIAVKAPLQGWFHENSDRDRIRGGEGDDLIIGNDHLDRLFGESGRDRFIGETIEARDLELFAGETIEAPLLTEQSSEKLRPIDALIDIKDRNLRIALAEALGYAITMGYDGKPIIHVPGGSLRTDVTLPNTSESAWSQRLSASRMAEISVLDAGSHGIVDLDGISFAINLVTVNLSGNNLLALDKLRNIDDDEELETITIQPLDYFIPGTSMDIATPGFPYGMKNLENLAIDFTPITDLSALEELTRMERLSFDGEQPSNVLTQVQELTYDAIVPGGGQRGLELLSLDRVVPQWVNNGDSFNGQIYIAEAGVYHFELIAPQGFGLLYVDGSYAASTYFGDPPAHQELDLAKGWHTIFYAPGTLDGLGLLIDPPSGPLQAVDPALLVASGDSLPITALDLLTVQDDLRVLSLRSQLVDDVRPLLKLNRLEVARLDDNRIRNIEDLVGQRLIDDGDEFFTLEGDWQGNLLPVESAFEGDYHFREGVDDTTRAMWKFTNLEPGTYEVLVTWDEAPSRSDYVKYVVQGNNTAVVTDLDGEDLFNSVSAPAPVTPLEGGHTVTVNTSTLTIAGDDADSATFYGTQFKWVTDGQRAILYVAGDLHVGADTINVTGARALSIVVGNDVFIDEGAVFNVSANGQQAGPGGGAGGGGGAAGTGGAGGSYPFLLETIRVGGYPGAGGAGGVLGNPADPVRLVAWATRATTAITVTSAATVPAVTTTRRAAAMPATTAPVAQRVRVVPRPEPDLPDSWPVLTAAMATPMPARSEAQAPTARPERAGPTMVPASTSAAAPAVGVAVAVVVVVVAAPAAAAPAAVAAR